MRGRDEMRRGLEHARTGIRGGFCGGYPFE